MMRAIKLQVQNWFPKRKDNSQKEKIQIKTKFIKQNKERLMISISKWFQKRY